MLHADTMFALLLILLGFGFIIFVHELGHFAVAKMVGIKVMQFAIGFGPAMCSYRKGMGLRRGSTERDYERRIRRFLMAEGKRPRGPEPEPPEPGETPGARAEQLTLAEQFDQPDIARASAALGLSETEYRINWIPLGGYVKMLGQEDLDPSKTSPDPRAFNNKSFSARAAVISAGVVMNLIFGVIFFTICFLHGVDFPPAIVGSVSDNEDMPAASTYARGHDGDAAYRGLQPGDHVVAINQRPINDFMELRIASALSQPEATLEVLIDRDGERLRYGMKPQPGADGLLAIGVAPPVSTQLRGARSLRRAGEPLPEALRREGIEPGMRITAVNGETTERRDQLAAAARRTPGGILEMKFEDDEGKSRTIEVPTVPGLEWSEGLDGIARPSLHGLHPATKIASVALGSVAEDGGLEAGDVFLRAGDADVPSFDRLIATIRAAAEKELELELLRDGERIEKALTPDHTGRLGFRPTPAQWAEVLAGSDPDGLFGELDLVPGSRILAVNGEETSDLPSVQLALMTAIERAREAAGENNPLDSISPDVTYELAIGSERPRVETMVDLNADAIAAIEAVEWTLPHYLDMTLFETYRLPVKRDNPVDAAILGFERTWVFLQQVYLTLGRLFQGTVPVDSLRGPVGIADEGTAIARQGWAYLLFFLGLISVNLAVINFLPLPIVDGGLMVILIIEKIKGSPVSPRVLNLINLLGLALILTIFLVVTYHDLARLIERALGG